MDVRLLKTLAWLGLGFALVAIYSWWTERAKTEASDRARGWRVYRYHGHPPDYEEFDGRKWHRIRFELRSTGNHQAELIPTPGWSEIRGRFKASRAEILQRLDVPGYSS